MDSQRADVLTMTGHRQPDAPPIALTCPHCNAPLQLVGHPSHRPPPPGPDLGDVMAALKRIETKMSKTATALASLAAADEELQTEVGALLGAVAAFPANVQTAVTAALEAAGEDDDANSTAVDAATKVANDLAAQIKSALAPPDTSGDGSTGDQTGDAATA